MSDFLIIDGVLKSYSGTQAHVVVPEGVTRIAPHAFMHCRSLTHITLPEGLQAIGVGAFMDCSCLQGIVIPHSVTQLDESAFEGCSGLQELILPPGLKSIPQRAFLGCSRLTQIVIPESVTSIDWDAFSYCNNLMHVAFPASVPYVSPSSFAQTPWWEQQGDFVCAHHVLVRYKGRSQHVVIPPDVTVIGNSAFQFCEDVLTICIPESVTAIRPYALSDCDGLTEIIIPRSVTQLGQEAFVDDIHLRRVVIPAGNLQCSARDFLGCTRLREVQAPMISPSDAEDETLLLALLRGFIAAPDSYSRSLQAEYDKYVRQQCATLFTTAVAEDDAAFLARCDQRYSGILTGWHDTLIRQAAEQHKTNALAWLLEYRGRFAAPGLDDLTLPNPEDDEGASDH